MLDGAERAKPALRSVRRAPVRWKKIRVYDIFFPEDNPYDSTLGESPRANRPAVGALSPG